MGASRVEVIRDAMTDEATILLAGDAGTGKMRYPHQTGGGSDEIIREVTDAARSWRTVATTAGLSRAEQERMADAFQVADEA